METLSARSESNIRPCSVDSTAAQSHFMADRFALMRSLVQTQKGRMTVTPVSLRQPTRMPGDMTALSQTREGYCGDRSNDLM